MCDNYIDQYDWFLRADDDAYFKMDKLIPFLNSLNHNERVSKNVLSFFTIYYIIM